jgi:hypothetical protein
MSTIKKPAGSTTTGKSTSASPSSTSASKPSKASIGVSFSMFGAVAVVGLALFGVLA